jgi:hypothetical protein
MAQYFQKVRRIFRLSLLSLCLNLPLAHIASASNAILFGASDYTVSPLSNPINDVNYLSSKLESLGWHVTVVKNPTSKNIKTSLQDFSSNLGNDSTDAVLVYFSGHGFQFSGENYLVPTDISSTDNMLEKSLSLSEISYYLRFVNAPKILIVDACRSAAFGEGSISVSSGLNSQNAPPNTLIAYATSPGKVAFDGPNDGYSPYAYSLGNAIGLSHDVVDVFRQTRIGTMALTDGEQIPWESSSLIQNVSFLMPIKTENESPSVETAPITMPLMSQDTSILIEQKKNEISDYLSAVEYLITVAENSTADAFFISYPKNSVSPSPKQDKKDIIATLNWEKGREIDRYSIYSIINALQSGVKFPSCNNNGKLDHNCGNADKQFVFEPNLAAAFKLATYANNQNINSSLLARHYEKGWLVQKNLIKAYDLYMKDKDQGSEYYWADANSMIQHELVSLGETISIDGDFGRKSCGALSKYIEVTECTNPVSREQVKRFAAKVLRSIN